MKSKECTPRHNIYSRKTDCEHANFRCWSVGPNHKGE